MNNELSILELMDSIIIAARSIEILRRPDLNLAQAQRMIASMKIEVAINGAMEVERERELNACCEMHVKTDMDELIEDDNRERARDMNAVNRGNF